MSRKVDDVLNALEVLADVIADRVADRLLMGSRPGWIDQGVSPLGRRRHCAVVRRRIAESAGGAAIIGRRFILSAETLAAEIESMGATTPHRGSPTITEQLKAELWAANGERIDEDKLDDVDRALLKAGARLGPAHPALRSRSRRP
jgi:hypothetical protein